MYVILSEAKDLKSKDRVKSDRMFEMFRFAQHDKVRCKFIRSNSELSNEYYTPIKNGVTEQSLRFVLFQLIERIAGFFHHLQHVLLQLRIPKQLRVSLHQSVGFLLCRDQHVHIRA